MKIVREEDAVVNVEVVKQEYTATVTPNTTNNISSDIGLMKGDLIVFRGNGDPVRFPAGNAANKTLLTDPTSETGWTIGDAGGGSTIAIATLHNITGEYIHTGTVVKLDTGENFVKATSADVVTLFVVSEDCNEDDDVDCYGIANSVCLIRCTTDAVSIGDSLKVSSTAGLCDKSTSTSDRVIATALSSKASGSVGTVKALLVGMTQIGVTDVEHGGTGATTVAGARNTLGLGNTSGAVPIANGGTGSTSASDARIALGLGTVAVESTVPLTKGGTGATTASDALTNLGFKFTISNLQPADAVSTANNTDVLLYTMALDPGLYIITYSVAFADNSTGYRFVSVTNGSDSDMGLIWKGSARPVSGSYTIISNTIPYKISTENYSLKFYAKQSSGSSLNVYFRSQVLRIL